MVHRKKSPVIAATMLLIAAGAASAGPGVKQSKQSCIVEVLRSEELPIGPLFHHTVKATLLVTASNAPPFETTVYKVIHWQMPPPRQGQRVMIPCDLAALNLSLDLFEQLRATSR